ncbi:MAG TPA: exopolyphosphatase [Burkholderiales bacterium]|nr:exopolyphosphatase [Burkholderiales bacterium]
MAEYETLAAVDLGSNSFHCQVARVVGDQFYPLDNLREPVRLGAGLRADKTLDEAVQERALACLERFGERLRGLDRHAVRAVGTNTLRVAKNSKAFLKRARAALGFPIDVIAGREEARLIFIGVQHGLPPLKEERLVVDIGGGSTELIIGSKLKPQRLESLYMGCVSYSLRYFPDGRLTRAAFKRAEIAARNELQPIVSQFSARHWAEAIGSSGTARALAEIAQINGLGDGTITSASLEKLRASMTRAGDTEHLDLTGVRPDRVPVLPGGLAILIAVLSELRIPLMTVATGGMREGLLYDLIGRVHRHDMRDVTVAQFMHRYHVDAPQARRVAALALALYRKLGGQSDEAMLTLDWAAKLHEIGISVAYSGYHRHSAYILESADMPGFSRDEQKELALLALAHRRSLRKVQPQLEEGAVDLSAVLALRLAVLFYRARTDFPLPSLQAKVQGNRVRLAVDPGWLERNSLAATALRDEALEWERIGRELRIPGLGDVDTAPDAAALVAEPFTAK